MNTANPPKVKLSALKSPFSFNPIAAKELAGRMRSVRAYTVLTVYLAIVSALAVLLYLIGFLSGARTIGGTGGVGTVVFYFLVGMQILLVSFVAPAFTVSAISSERERQTYDLLRTTMLVPRQIAWAKLVSGLGFTLLLVFATLPLYSLAFLLGGVEPTELAMTLCVTLAAALLFSLLGLYISARSKSTVGAAVVTYALVIGLVVGVPLASLIGSSTLSLALASATPASASAGRESFLVGVLEVVLTLAISVSPISAIAASRAFFSNTGDVLTFQPDFVGVGSSLTLPSPFLILTVLYVILAVVLFVLTVRQISRIEPS
jgi:ABC-type transport system involved in multi-copper enzyme maturation permease subunit